MNLKPRAIILLAIDAFGGSVGGKTLPQKRLYFTEDPDYMDLSFAAKSHWILCQAQKPLSDTDIAQEAARFGWEVKPEQVHRGVEFLHQLGLV